MRLPACHTLFIPDCLCNTRHSYFGELRNIKLIFQGLEIPAVQPRNDYAGVYQKSKQMHKYFSFMEAKKPCLPFSPDILFTPIQCDSNCRGYVGMFSVRQIFSFFQCLCSSFGHSSISIVPPILLFLRFLLFLFLYCKLPRARNQ